MKDIWSEQKKHIQCIQDLPSVQLYTLTGHTQKGGVTLPVWRCARGSTSLESFHLHLAFTFIPGTSANAVNFQAYLMEGITRWNVLRAKAAIYSPSHPLRTFDSRLQHQVCYYCHTLIYMYCTIAYPLIQQVNFLGQSLLGTKMFPNFEPPAKYTGEAFGILYLYQQSGRSEDEDLDQLIDEGFEDFTEEEDSIATDPSGVDPHTLVPPFMSDSESNDDEEVWKYSITCA